MGPKNTCRRYVEKKKTIECLSQDQVNIYTLFTTLTDAGQAIWAQKGISLEVAHKIENFKHDHHSLKYQESSGHRN